MTMQASSLLLKNKTVFPGWSPAWQKNKVFSGEVVFNTGMTGYVESLTDPSYTNQILVFTYPLIGNYGVPGPRRWESKKIHVSGVVVGSAVETWNHYEGRGSLTSWLQSQQVPLITGVDTRALTRILRGHGTMPGAIVSHAKGAPRLPIFNDEIGTDLMKAVSIKRPRIYGSGPKKIIVVDCGMKENIIRSLLRFPVTIKRVPYDYDYTRESFDGLFVSNGPGDPADCRATIEILQKALSLKNPRPIFGICLGSQLLAIAAGAKTYKLPFGHRGHNQPCLELNTGRGVVTSQNHGYAVDEASIPVGWQVTYRNLNDGSVEGLAHATQPFFSVQFHPEAAPGPTDTKDLFEKFFALL